MRNLTALLCLLVSLTSTAVLVMACDSEGSGTGSTLRLLSPDDGAVLDNGCRNSSNRMDWVFDWSNVTNADTYHLFVKHEGSQFAAVDDSALTASEHARSSSGFVVDQNRFDWFWRVRASVDGTWSPWSEERSFDVEPLNTDC